MKVVTREIKKMSLMQLPELTAFVGTKAQIKGSLVFFHYKQDMNKVSSALFHCLCLSNVNNGRKVLPLGHKGFKSINNLSE